MISEAVNSLNGYLDIFMPRKHKKSKKIEYKIKVVPKIKDELLTLKNGYKKKIFK